MHLLAKHISHDFYQSSNLVLLFAFAIRNLVNEREFLRCYAKPRMEDFYGKLLNGNRMIESYWI
jgi:hypothetical protein